MALLPPPHVFGLPEKFKAWRTHQDRAILAGVDSATRFQMQVCPTGAGKSLGYVTIAVLRGGRCAILTSTKALQTQLLRDFGEMGAVDIRGRNAYRCNYEHDGTTCDHGPCIAGVECPLKTEGGCSYYDALRRAKQANIVITNYAYWMTQNAHGTGLGKFNLLVCDEAHDAPNHVSDFLAISFDVSDPVTSEFMVRRDKIPSMTFGDWKRWAREIQEPLAAELEVLKRIVGAGGDKRTRRRYARLRSLLGKVESLLKISEEEWVFEAAGATVVFSPIWPADACEDVLFLGIPHVHLTSASVRAKTAEMMGISPDELEVLEYPHTFPLKNRRLIHTNTFPPVRVNHRMTKADERVWLTRIEQILRQRQDRKGIIHTVSYARRDLIITSSEFRSAMITHKTADAETAVRRFKQADPPAVLVSPSMATGHDFPYAECEYQIIGKIAYPDTRSPIVRARSKRDKDYPAYVAMQQLVQAVGRGVRAPDDRCETIIVDDNIRWFMPRYKHFAPEWFRSAYTSVNVVPPPPPPLFAERG